MPGWTFDFWVVFPLALTMALFVTGYMRVRARATAAPQPRAQTAAFIGGWCVLAFALVSPLHEAGERSFTAHMLEHELLMLVAAPLLVAAHANGIFLWAMPRRLRIGIAHFFLAKSVAGTWRTLTDPLIATFLQAIVLWVWHAPLLFDLALRSPGWHILQHLSFLIGALLFWSAMFDFHHRRRRIAVVIGCLFATAVVSGALGALMAFSQSPWYEGYRALQLTGFGLTPAQDQQVAGLLMWIPGGLVHVGVALALLGGTLRATERSHAQ
jgi:putative membrane protein